MGINEIILYLMLGLMTVAGVDRFMGNKLGIGEKFEEGFMAMGALTMSMVGAICIAPALGSWLEPVVGPIYSALGASPAMFATTLLANDMGGYSLAMALSGANLPGAPIEAQNAGNFAGLILGAMMGPTIVFSIPVALGIISLEDRPFLAKGILIGMIT
ncbi:MAG: ethanolamine utilization protein EutH, partial [Candidatus Adiutrix sp.]